MQHPKDARQWRLSRKRAAFKRNVFTYLIVNIFLWAVWWYSSAKYGTERLPWPVWVMLVWSIALAFQFLQAYIGNKKLLSDSEYKNLQQQQHQL
jgi:amino acid transporter